MTKTAIVAAFAAVLAASPMALAQTQPETQSQTQGQAQGSAAGMPAAGDTAIQGKLMPNQVLAGHLKGAEVYDSANQKVGTVKDIVVGQTGKVVAVVLDTDNRNVAVSMQDLKIAKENGGSGIQKVMLNVSQAQLKTAPAVDLDTGTGSSGGGNPAAGSEGAGGGGGATGGNAGGANNR